MTRALGVLLRVCEAVSYAHNKRVMHRDLKPSNVMIGRFLEEAQVTGQLDHPGIVPVHELGVDPAGRPYFTMQLVRGRSLREVFASLRPDGRRLVIRLEK